MAKAIIYIIMIGVFIYTLDSTEEVILVTIGLGIYYILLSLNRIIKAIE